MSKAMRVRIESNGQFNGTHVYDAKDGEELINVIAVRFDSRIDHTPIVSIELLGGEILLTDAALGLVEIRRSGEGQG
jgi:hypothetical protein